VLCTFTSPPNRAVPLKVARHQHCPTCSGLPGQVRLRCHQGGVSWCVEDELPGILLLCTRHSALLSHALHRIQLNSAVWSACRGSDRPPFLHDVRDRHQPYGPRHSNGKHTSDGHVDGEGHDFAPVDTHEQPAAPAPTEFSADPAPTDFGAAPGGDVEAEKVDAVSSWPEGGFKPPKLEGIKMSASGNIIFDGPSWSSLDNEAREAEATGLPNAEL
jgi:hypothetical protein